MLWVQITNDELQSILIRRACNISGKCLLFDTAVLPITVCRRIIAWIRETPLHVFVPMDNHRSMHRALSLSVCVLAFLHAVSAISSDGKMESPSSSQWFQFWPFAEGWGMMRYLSFSTIIEKHSGAKTKVIPVTRA